MSALPFRTESCNQHRTQVRCNIGKGCTCLDSHSIVYIRVLTEHLHEIVSVKQGDCRFGSSTSRKVANDSRDGHKQTRATGAAVNNFAEPNQGAYVVAESAELVGCL